MEFTLELTSNPAEKESKFIFDQLENFNLAIVHYKHFINLSSPSQSDLVYKVQMHVDELTKEIKKKK